MKDNLDNPNVIKEAKRESERLINGKRGASLVYQCFCEIQYGSNYEALFKHDDICSFYNNSKLKYELFYYAMAYGFTFLDLILRQIYIVIV